MRKQNYHFWFIHSGNKAVLISAFNRETANDKFRDMYVGSCNVSMPASTCPHCGLFKPPVYGEWQYDAGVMVCDNARHEHSTDRMPEIPHTIAAHV